MIRKQEHSEMAKVATVEFGRGRVHMIAGVKELADDTKLGILFLDTNDEPKQIGAKQAYNQPELVRDCDHEVVMTFENTESIDAVISSLIDVKKTMLISKATKKAEFYARANAIVAKLHELRELFTNMGERLLSARCMELVDSMHANVFSEGTAREVIFDSLSDVGDTVKELYYNETTPANDAVCPELLVLIDRLIVDLVELI